MNFGLFSEQICGREIPTFLIFDFSTAPPLLFYSYIPIIILSLIISLYIFIKDKKSLQGKLLLIFTLFFISWIINILILWISSYHAVLMFGWQLTAFFEVGMYIAAGYFSYAFLYKRNISFFGQIIFTLIMITVAILTPTRFNISSYDIYNCEGVVGGLWNIIYFLEPLLIVWITYLGFNRFREINERLYKKQTILFTLGMVIFLTIFFLSNFYAELTGVYEFNFWGPFGMVLFLGFLTYIIVKFKVFNLKIISSNVLVFALWILMGSLLAIEDINVSHAVTAVTLIVSIIFGLFLIQSVRKEVTQREKNEKLAADLTRSNTRLLELDKQKSEFVSFATHQLRAPLTAMRGYTSLILEGDMGPVNPEVKEAVGRVSDSSRTLVNIVDDYLNISRVELGTIKYTFDLLDIAEMTRNVVDELKPNIEKKGLKFEFTTNPATQDARFMVHADKDKLKQVVSNLIDNSVKYTPSGSLSVLINKNTSDRKILLSIKDTGVGISPAVMPKLFEKFVRADNANKQNIFGTGLGLYIAKQIVMAHKGRVWAESEGEGKGSTFFLELDMEV